MSEAGWADHRAAYRQIAAIALCALAGLVISAGDAIGGHKTWTTTGPGSEVQVHGITVWPSSPTTIFAGTFAYPDGRVGIWKSIDDGTSWSTIGRGLTGHVFAIVPDPSRPNTMYVGTFGVLTTPVYKSVDGGATWVAASNGINDRTIDALVVDPGNPSTLYAGGPNEGLFRSTDGAATWEPRNPDMNWVQKIALDPHDPSIVYMAGYGLARSDDRGETWRSLSSGEQFEGDIVRSMAIDPSDPRIIYIGCDFYGIFKSTDAGESWRQVRPDLSNSIVAELVIDPHHPSTVYAAITGAGVFKSSDAGETWAPLNDGLTDPNVWSLAIDPSRPTTLYAGARQGLVYQLDQGPLCGDGVLDEGEQCDDGNRANGDCCSSTCQFKSSASVCRLASGECDVAETCTGSSGTCPADAHVPSGAACSDDGSACTEDYCDGSGACVHPTAPAGRVCRPAAGDCDVAEVCDGLVGSCPTDRFKVPTTVCRAAVGECDLAEQCDGSSPSCPSDRMKPATVVCRESAGECDVRERCTGTSPSCPADARVPGGTSCTPDTEVCTLDVCDGVSVTCTHPAGNAGTACRAAAGICDVAEVCDGMDTACPADTGLRDSDADGVCDAQDPCTNVARSQDFTSPPRSKLVLSRINTDSTAGNDKLTITALFDLPVGRSFADLRPHLHGARVLLDGVAGNRLIDVALPPGAYTPASRAGWRSGRRGKVWTYTDIASKPLNGVVKLTVTDGGQVSPRRRVKVVVTGKNGAYPIAPADSPVRVALTLGDAADAAAGLCGESAYTARDCSFNGRANTLKCQR